MDRRLRVSLVIGFILAAILFFYSVRGILLPFLVGVFLTYLIAPLVDRMERRQVPRVVAIAVIYALLVAAAWLVLLYVWPRVATELQRMVASLPGHTARISDELARLTAEPVRGSWRAFLQMLAKSGVRESQALAGRIAGRIVQVSLSLFSQAVLVILGPVVAYYLIRDLGSLREATLQVLPVSSRDDVLALFRDINDVLSGYIRGQIIVSSFVGVFTTIGLMLLGVPYAFLIGLLAGLFDVIPYFGPIIAGIPAVGFAFGRSPWLAVYVLILLFLIHQFEGAILVPRVIGRRTGLHPVTVIFAILAGGELFGVVGMLVAVPVTAVLKVVLRFAVSKVIRAYPLS